jgi:Uma2 family endonuclease
MAMQMVPAEQNVYVPRSATWLRAVPPLQSGDRLSRREFERRYNAMPELKKAELIEGVVYMGSPLRIDHARPHAKMMTWLGTYVAATPLVDVLDNVSTRLDSDNEVQPDALLRIREKAGGQSRESEGFIEGAPELVVEIAVSSAAIDANTKKQVYRRAGVREYILWRVYDRAIDWFVLREGEYESLAADEDGITRGEIFPGLWLARGEMLAERDAQVLGVLQTGLTSEAHQAFVKQMEERVEKRAV